MAVVNELNGIICVNKPAGFTSFDVIAKMRGILKMRRLGHGGTLDPMATGVLPVFAGSAAKASEMLPDHDKIYVAGFKLGTVTDTQDCTGKVLSESDKPVSREELDAAAERFKGSIMQIPPMYSAVSVNGKRLYELARQGVTVERKPRPITVYTLDILEYDVEKREGKMKIACSKGTYIRTLINDIGEALGCGGIMTSLERTAACGFSISDCVTLEQLQQEADRGGDFSSFVLPVAEVFGYLPKVHLSAEQERMYRNGIRLDIDRVKTDEPNAERYAVYGVSEFIGTAVIMPEERLLKVEKNFF